MTHTPEGEVVANLMDVSEDVNKHVAYSGDAITMYTHTGTHIDTLNHFGYENEIFNGFTSKDILAAGHGMSAAQKTFR
jgi:kynurenine formamidase